MDKYLNTTEVESAVIGLANGYPDLCDLITLPFQTVGGNTSHALRIGIKNNFKKPGVLIMACAHAREWGGAEISINFAVDLLSAFSNQTGVQYGGKSYDVNDINYIMSSLDTFIFPLINPDGRKYSQETDISWRKNRNGPGVDLNRNYDFLWNDPSYTNNNPLNPAGEFYKGVAAGSEAETRNVVWLVNQYPYIGRLMDIHSGMGDGEDLLWGWSDGNIQSTDPSMSFSNPVYFGQRGDPELGYAEYMPPKDAKTARMVSDGMAAVIKEVRGKSYFSGPGDSFYGFGSNGLATDYFYSLNLEYPQRYHARPVIRILGFGIEFAKMSPVQSVVEMTQIIADVDAALFQFCLMALPVRLKWNAFLGGQDWPFSLQWPPKEEPGQRMKHAMYMSRLAMQIEDEKQRNKTVKLLLNHALDLSREDDKKKVKGNAL